MGTSSGIGRLGAISGPLIGGALLTADVAYPWGFYIFAAVAAVGAVAIAMVNRTPAPDEPMPLTEACPRRPVVAVVGDGSLLYGLQALWSAVHYGCGVLFVILANGRYAIMDRLAERHGNGKAPWPPFEEVSIRRLAQGLGCPAERIDGYDALTETLDRVVPTLVDRAEPLVLEVAVVPDTAFQP